MSYVAELVAKGGPLIYPLLVLLLWGAYIIVAKSLTLRRARVINPAVIEQVEELLLEKKVAQATAFCKQHALPMTRVLLAAILNHEKSEEQLKEILEEAGRQELPRIRSQLTALGTIASVAPLLGLLGTVIGMISVFAALSQEDGVSAASLAGGISEALITTACGMIVAVPTLVFYNYFINRVQILTIEMEKISLHMVNVLKRS